MSPKPFVPIAPDLDEQGHDSYPFVLHQGPSSTPYGHWFDLVLARDRLSPQRTNLHLYLTGYHPSHDMQPWLESLNACAVCHVVEDTDGGIMPCGMSIGTLTLTEAATEARQAAEAARR